MSKQKLENTSFATGTVSKSSTRREKVELPEAVMASLDDNLSVSLGSSCERSGDTSMRRNSSGSITRTDRFSNLERGVVPFIYGSGRGNYDSNISAKDTIVLCQKAYWNISVFRSTVETQTEFCNSKLHFKGKNKKTENSKRSTSNCTLSKSLLECCYI